MKNLKSKSMAILIAAILTISMGASMMLLPSANAHTPAWIITSYAYLTVNPSPVGVGQPVGVYMWVDHAMSGASEVPGAGNDVRRHNYQLTTTAPDGTVSTQTWAVVNDPTGIQSYYFTPTQVGNYTLVFYYPSQNYTFSGAYNGDMYTASTASPKVLVVQQDPIPTQTNPALPTAYWTYPIFGENYNWYSVASNWLGTPYIVAFASHTGQVQPYGSAPNTSHMMWTQPIQWGGVVGGNETSITGEAYYQGGSYNTRFASAIIMQGTLFFALPFGESGSGGNYVAWDLKTGQQQWSINTSATGVSLVPSFGYLPSMDQPNQHGILPNGALVASTTVTGLGTVWRFYDPMTGVLTPMNVTNVPAGTNVAGPMGEYLKLALTNYGTSTAPKYMLSQWNSTNVFGVYAGTGTSYWYTGTVNASAATAYDWNVSVNLGPGTWTMSTSLIDYGNIMLLTQGSFGSRAGVTDPANITAMSLKPGSIGNVLWTQSYPIAPGNNTRVLSAWDPDNGVFIFWDQEAMDHYGFSLSTGKQLWGPVTVPTAPNTDWNYMGDSASQENILNGNLYWAGYMGFVYCFDDQTGNLKWTFGNGGEGNSTYAPWLPYGYTPMFISCIADGKIYLSSSEHSPNSPLYANYDERCINATTGLEIWAMPCFGNLMYGGYTPIASGYLVADNTYDQQIDCFGQGPSALTVTAPDTAAPLGSTVVIRGTVTDVSAGTKQDQQVADFPNGVPCVSDASMDSWMQYVYMQQPRPNNATGVSVTISVIDSNGNQRPIGTTTSDSSGMFTYAWTPDITGSYTVIATFAGSNAYYPSSAETSFYTTAAPATASPQPTQAPPMSDLYFVPAIAGLFVAIIVVGALMAILLLRKRP